MEKYPVEAEPKENNHRILSRYVTCGREPWLNNTDVSTWRETAILKYGIGDVRSPCFTEGWPVPVSDRA